MPFGTLSSEVTRWSGVVLAVSGSRYRCVDCIFSEGEASLRRNDRTPTCLFQLYITLQDTCCGLADPRTLATKKVKKKD